jgi:hypothetical protein
MRSDRLIIQLALQWLLWFSSSVFAGIVWILFGVTTGRASFGGMLGPILVEESCFVASCLSTFGLIQYSNYRNFQRSGLLYVVGIIVGCWTGISLALFFSALDSQYDKLIARCVDGAVFGLAYYAVLSVGAFCYCGVDFGEHPK